MTWKPLKCEICGKYVDRLSDAFEAQDYCQDCVNDMQKEAIYLSDLGIENCPHRFNEGEGGDIVCDFCGVTQKSWNENRS